MMNRKKGRTLVALLAWILVAGCESPKTFSETEASNLKPLAVMYGRYIGSNQGRGPKDQQEFKAFIQSRPKEELTNLNASDVESLFVSSRDKKPYKFKFDSKPAVPGQSANIFAWEQDGLDGKRYVAGTLGEILEIDEQKFRELVPNP
jgi:hypothetical protein